jgi:hypothetical protein
MRLLHQIVNNKESFLTKIEILELFITLALSKNTHEKTIISPLLYLPII